MTSRALARRYAGALFDVARRGGTLDGAGRDLAGMRDLLAAHAPLRQAFQSPGVPPARKRALMAAILDAAGPVSADVRRLLLLLAERDRVSLLADLAEAYDERAMAARRVLSAEVVTAMPLGDGRREAVARALSQASGCDVTVHARVDPSIIGGIIARVGSVVYDASVTRQLEKMRQRLLQEF